MEWSQIKVKCERADLDKTVAVMSMVDSGLMIEDYSDIEENLMPVYGELIDDSILHADRNICYVSCFVPQLKDLNDSVAFINERLTSEGVAFTLTVEGVSEEEWTENWKKYYKPVKIGKKLVVVPMWEEYEPLEVEVIVRMDPGMAFGTGTHETTRLCAAMLEKYLKKGDRVLDIGTGSGILSLFASGLGAESADAYDMDPVAVRVAEQNAAANHMDNVSCSVSDLLSNVPKGKKYTLALANIVADILIRMAPDIAAYLEDEGLLICSGIIDSRADDVAEAMQRGGLELFDSDEDSDWKVMVFKKPALRK